MEGETIFILRCDHCNKPFDKESTLKRHGYYCRSRKTGGKPRVRSCLPCSKAKARCDNKQPQCSRCVGKAIECQYPATVSKVKRANDQQSNEAGELWKVAPPSPANTPLAEAGPETGNLDEMVIDSELDTASFGWIDWNNIDFTDILDLQPYEKATQFSPAELSFAPYMTPSSELSMQQSISSFDLSIPPSPYSNTRSIVQRSKRKGGPQRIADLILHILKSYPLMMLRHKGLPPFIHPSLINDENNEMEPLTTCINLMNMISNDMNGSRKLFWKNVRWECERLREEHQSLSKWELLAAMQALSIYVLVRVDEGETEYNNFDSLLTSTVTAIAKQLAGINVQVSSESAIMDSSLHTAWNDWVFEESRRRLCVVYQVVNMLVYFEPAAMCDHPTDLILAPLPAKKQLWEAVDESAWKMEVERDPNVQTAFGLAANGDLVTLGDDLIYCKYAVQANNSLTNKISSRTSANWEEWCSGMDGFGGLVMLAASLVG